LRGWDRGIEALDVPNLEDASGSPRGSYQPVCFFERRGHRLFDQHVQAGIEKAAADSRVLLRGHGKADGIDLRRGERVEVGEDVCAEFRGDLPRALGVRVRNARQFGPFKLAPQADVVPAELADTDYGHANRFLAHDFTCAPAGSGVNA
jgi:hypothetical protein